jgi:hypothetical protein
MITLKIRSAGKRQQEIPKICLRPLQGFFCNLCGLDAHDHSSWLSVPRYSYKLTLGSLVHKAGESGFCLCNADT